MQHHVVGIDLEQYRDGLSPEERAAIEPEPEKPSAEEIAALEAIVREGEEPGDTERRPFVPMMEVRPVENFDERLAEIDERKAAVRGQRRDGEIEFDDAEAQIERLEQQRADLVLQQRDAVRAHQHNQAAALQDWSAEVSAFLRQHGQYAEDQVLWDSLDATVKRLANQTDAQGNYVNADKDARWFLDEAHRLVAARARVDASDDGTGEGQGDEAARLSFAQLDRLTGLDLEHALASLSPEDQAAYLRGE